MSTIVTSIRLNLKPVDQEPDTLVHNCLMRPQQAAMHVAYNRLIEGKAEKTTWNILRRLFPLLTGRNLNDAIVLAKGTIESQQELLPEQIIKLDQRIDRVKRHHERELQRRRGPRPERLKALQAVLRELKGRRDELQSHLDAGTVPPALFGQRKTWQKLPGSLAEWRHRRACQFFSRGACKKKGNPHCRLSVIKNGAVQLLVRISTGLKKHGKKPTTAAKWLTFEVEYSRRYNPVLQQLALDGAANRASYTVRLMRLSAGQYQAYVTIDEPVAQMEYNTRQSLPASITLAGGVDLNLDHLTIQLTDRQGQYRQRQVFEYHNLGELPRNKSKWRIGNLARDAINWLKEQQVQALVIEDLDISDQGNGSAPFNRRTVPFCYRQLVEALVRRALREGLAVKRVNPAYTSWIGQLKYSPQYGISRHAAAAYVIARRGLGLQERIPKHLIVKFPGIASLIRDNIDQLKTKLSQTTGDDRKKLVKQLSTRREWLRRLENYGDYLPEKGKPWLLWVTLYLAGKTIREVKAILFKGVVLTENTPSGDLFNGNDLSPDLETPW